MKKTFLLAFAVLAFASCQNKKKPAEATTAIVDKTTAVGTFTPVQNPNGSTLTFTEDVHNFGAIKKGEIVTYAFKFTNTGKEPLIIKDALSTCGCTVPEIPKKPIKPGESGEIKVVFNSAGKPVGPITKPITVSSNAVNSPVQISMVGEIKE
ncbi:DUF1573 domain-containing protein [Pedobacter sp. PWIIR3]